MRDTILVTIHGSHLYGLAHGESDLDFFRVVSGSGRTKMKVTGGFDITQMPLDRFLINAMGGSHQSLEAMFAPGAWVHPQYRALFNGYRAYGPEVEGRYRRTIRAFAYGDLKKRRHAVRLGTNLGDLRRTGRFNPELNDDQRERVITWADAYEGDNLFQLATNI